jgi:putative addiction module component (TIGR02574 family)
LTEAQKQELERRIANLDADPDSVIPWEVVEARALARLKR